MRFSDSGRCAVKEAREYYDEFSVGYDRGRERGYHALIDELEGGLVVKLGKGKRVLEAGCGTGLILERIEGKCPAPIGMDLSRGMLLRARERGFRVIQADIADIPFGDATFDLTCSFKVLPHVQDVARAMSELARVTSPGGYILAEFYNRSSLRYLIRAIKGPRKISSTTTDREVYTRYDGWKEMVMVVPQGCRLVGQRGIRIFTLHPSLLALPLIGRLLRFLETRCCDGPLRRFAGFVVLVLQRMDS